MLVPCGGDGVDHFCGGVVGKLSSYRTQCVLLMIAGTNSQAVDVDDDSACDCGKDERVLYLACSCRNGCSDAPRPRSRADADDADGRSGAVVQLQESVA